MDEQDSTRAWAIGMIAVLVAVLTLLGFGFYLAYLFLHFFWVQALQ